jgi:PAS domain S-box-containing protein
MNDTGKTKQQLIKELAAMRERVTDLENSQVLFTARDIADRKQDEEILQKSEEKYHRLVEDAHDMIMTTDLNFNITYANKLTLNFAGGIDLVGRSLLDFTPPHLHQLQKEIMQKRREGFNDVLAYEWEFADSTGKITTFDVRAASLTEEGKPSGVMFIARDITERKNAEAQLNESEEKYRLVVENAQEAIIVIQDFKLIFANHAAADMSGYTEEMFAARPFTEFLHPDDRNLVFENHLKRMKGEAAPGIYSHRFIGRDGSVKWVENNSIRIQWKGKPAIICFLNDITERKIAEEALKESEERLRILAEVSYEGIALIEKGMFVDCNDQLLAMLGYTRDELMGRKVLDVVLPDDRNFVVGRIVVDQTEPYEHFALRKDGSVFPVEVRARVTYIGGRRLRVSVVRDMTERKRAEKIIQEKQEELQTLMDASPVGISSADMQGNIQYINRKFGELFGYTLEDIPNVATWRTLVYPDPAYSNTITPIVNLLIEAQKQGKNSISSELTITCKDGSIRQVMQVAAFAPNRILTIFNDITERKSLQERLTRAEKMESLGTLAGGVAHDLNNVLGVLVGYSELLADMLPEDSPLREHADNILQSGVRGAAIIQNLLTMARRGVTFTEVVNLNKIVSDYLQTPELEELKSRHLDVKIQTDLEEGLLNIKGSPIHLGKTIMNLISNATEAIPNQGEVTIRTENRYLDQPIRGYDYIQEGDYVVLTVSDTGSGIAANDLGKIFEPFYTKKVMGRSGTGLGLAVVWGTVKDHNGYIDVQSETGKGSTFILYFPVTREEPAIAEKAVSPVSYLGKGESILVVDDVKAQRELAMSMLRRLGYQVEAVAGGEEAIEYIKNKKADLIVLDMIMDPGIDGLETYRRILEINPGQKAIIVSGFSETDRVRKVQEMGAGSFVRKPYLMERIGMGVRRELDRK